MVSLICRVRILAVSSPQLTVCPYPRVELFPPEKTGYCFKKTTLSSEAWPSPRIETMISRLAPVFGQLAQGQWHVPPPFLRFLCREHRDTHPRGCPAHWPIADAPRRSVERPPVPLSHVVDRADCIPSC